MWALLLILSYSAHFYLGSLALPDVQSSMGLTQPTRTCHTLLSPLRLVQQGTLSVWYWGSGWTPQLCTTTLCLQLVETSRWQCEETSQHHSIVSILREYLICGSLWVEIGKNGNRLECCSRVYWHTSTNSLGLFGMVLENLYICRCYCDSASSTLYHSSVTVSSWWSMYACIGIRSLPSNM